VLADHGRATVVSQGKPVERVHGQVTELLGIVESIHAHHRHHEDSDDNEHEGQTRHDIEERVDPEAKHQVGVLLELLLALRHLELHLHQQSLSELLFKVWFLLEIGKVLEHRKDIIELGGV
jgi:hypothetical protein